jgi:hypothetical protein
LGHCFRFIFFHIAVEQRVLLKVSEEGHGLEMLPLLSPGHHVQLLLLGSDAAFDKFFEPNS